MYTEFPKKKAFLNYLKKKKKHFIFQINNKKDIFTVSV